MYQADRHVARNSTTFRRTPSAAHPGTIPASTAFRTLRGRAPQETGENIEPITHFGTPRLHA